MTLPLLWASLAFMAGIALASAVMATVWVWVVLLLLALLGLIVVRRVAPPLLTVATSRQSAIVRREHLLLVVVVAASLFAGAVRFQAGIPATSSSFVVVYNDTPFDILVTGTLAEPPDVRDTYTNLRLRTTELDAGSGPMAIAGLLLARVPAGQDLHYGDHVRLRGRLQTPPATEDFNFRDYLARQGIHSYMRSASITRLPGNSGNPALRIIYGWKQAALDNVHRIFLDPEASLLAGILLGVDTGMSRQLRQAFNDTGTSHIIAISGFNIAVIAGILIFVFNRTLGPRLGAIAAAAGIILYTIFVGADPPVLRAALMGLVGLLAVQVGRRQVGINTLAAVSAVMALFKPLLLWDVGFQLSVLATLGLIIYGGPFMTAGRTLVERFLPASEFRTLVSSLAQFILLTFAAQLTTLPIVVFHFKQISLVSPVANALILPVQPAVMVLGGAATAFSLLIFPLGQVLAWVAWPFATYTIRIVEALDRLPHAVLYLGRSSFVAVLLFYACLLAATLAGSTIMVFVRSLKARLTQVGFAVGLATLTALALLLWRVLAVAPDGHLHITVLDVGSADAIYIQGPAGGRILINGGSSALRVSDALGRRMSPFEHDLDWVVVASADENQVAALPTLLPRFPPGEVLWGAPEQASASSAALLEHLQEDGVSLTTAELDQRLSLGAGASLQVVDVSTRGLTLLLEWNSFRMLLPVGANLDTLQTLESGEAIGPVSALLLAQSGYAPLTPSEWLHQLSPRLIVISVDAADADGLPSAETLALLKDYPVLRTDVNGWIEITTDGSRMWTSVERQAPQAP